MSSLKQVIVPGTTLDYRWDQEYPGGWFDPDKAHQVWEHQKAKERLYLTANKGWVVEDVNFYTEGYSRYVLLNNCQAHSWLATLEKEDRKDFDIGGGEI